MQPGRRLVAVPLLLLSCAAVASACTLVGVGGRLGGGGSEMWGRSMEIALQWPSATWFIGSHRRGDRMGHGPYGPVGTVLCDIDASLEWTNNYTFAGVEAGAMFAGWVPEGMNEAGLTVSALTLRMSEYPAPRNATAARRGLCHANVVPYLLGTAGTVAAARDALNSVSVYLDVAVSSVLHSHWHISDATGAAAVAEFIGGKMVWTPDTAGVLTNDPEYTWHLSNVANYAALDPRRHDESPAGSLNGGNLLGIPGDLTPASRFVRMYYLRKLALDAAPNTQATVLLQSLLNTVHIVAGTVAKTASGQGHRGAPVEKTHWAVMKDPARRMLYVRTYSKLQWQAINLTAVAALARRRGAPPPSPIPMAENEISVVDISSQV